MQKIPMTQIKLRSATGTAVLSGIKVFDDIGRVIYGGDGSKTANVVSTSWQLLSALLGADWTNNLNSNGYGMQATLSGQNLSVSYSKGGDDPADQDGATVTYEVGSTILIGSVPDQIYDAVGGEISAASASFTRPNDTTPYAAADLVANNTTAGDVTPMQFSVGRLGGASGMIRRARIKKSGANPGTFRLHLFKTSPTVTNGDNGAFLPNNSANYLGALAISADRVFSDGVVGGGVPLNGSEMSFVLPAASTVLYGLLEATAATTPAAQEVFTIELEVIRV